MSAFPAQQVLLFAQQHRTLLYATCQALAGNIPIRPVHAWVGFDPGWLRRSRLLQSVNHRPSAGLDDGSRVESLIAWAESLGGGFLLPVDNEDFLLVARHRKSFPKSVRLVPMADADVLETITDKLRFARQLASMSLPVPETHDLAEWLDDARHPERSGFPVIVKQARAMAGRGTFRARDIGELRSQAPTHPLPGQWLAQRWVPGEDVALTLLADDGEVFAAFLRKRWFHRPGVGPLSPIQDVEFFECDWIEQMGREWVSRIRFTGIADFDLRVDFRTRQAWFLECDPRMMGGVLACHRFGINVPGLLVERAQFPGLAAPCRRAQSGRYLSIGSLRDWLLSGSFPEKGAGPTRTSLPHVISDPTAMVARLREQWMQRRRKPRSQP